MVSSMELKANTQRKTVTIIQWQGFIPKAVMTVTNRQAKTLMRLLKERGF